MSGKQLIVDTGTSLVVARPGEQLQTINDKESLQELRALLEKRKQAGLEISKYLKAHGIQVAGEESTATAEQ